MKLLFKLLRRNISILQTLLFLAVNLLGGVIVLLGIEAYRDFASISRNDGDALSTSSIVINKSLSADATLNSIMGLHPSFSEEEIRELESLPSVASVGKFVTARFGVGAVLSIASSRMSTDIFLEAVPDEFVLGNYRPVDGVSCRWSATLSSDTIPVIIPRNYLNLYNFGYAASNGMPQIGDDLIGYLPLQLVVMTPKGRVVYNAVLCGLTDKFNTILVPWDFLNEANDAYAKGTSSEPSRLMLTTDASEFDEDTFEFLAQKGYAVEGDATQVKLQNFIYTLLYIIIGVGAVFSTLAFVLLVISILLLIEKNKEKIRNLYSLGYSVKEISRVYRLFVFVVDLVVWLIAASMAVLVYPMIVDVLNIMSQGYQPLPLSFIWMAAVGFALMFAMLHSVIIYRNVRKTVDNS